MAQTFIVFDAPNASLTYAASINKKGGVGGYFFDASQGNRSRGYVRDSTGNVIVFDVPNASGVEVVSINKGGDLTGSLQPDRPCVRPESKREFHCLRCSQRTHHSRVKYQ